MSQIVSQTLETTRTLVIVHQCAKIASKNCSRCADGFKLQTNNPLSTWFLVKDTQNLVFPDMRRDIRVFKLNEQAVKLWHLKPACNPMGVGGAES